jgi:hypothetical protein
MILTTLEGAAVLVTQRAQRQGSISPREVREELARAGVPTNLWKDVLARARASLRYHRGRYYYDNPVTTRAEAEQAQQREIQLAVQQLIAGQRADAARVERREQDRIDFIHPVQVATEDGHATVMLTRDLSETGLRLLSTRRLLGQKVHVRIDALGGAGPWEFLVRILWTCPVGDELVENGGIFLPMSREERRFNHRAPSLGASEG